MSNFDLIAHHRRRTRAAERRADTLELQRAKLERMLALAVRVASADGRDCDPLVLVEMIEELDRLTLDPPEPTIGELVVLLRDTDPGRIGRAA